MDLQLNWTIVGLLIVEKGIRNCQNAKEIQFCDFVRCECGDWWLVAGGRRMADYVNEWQMTA